MPNAFYGILNLQTQLRLVHFIVNKDGIIFASLLYFSLITYPSLAPLSLQGILSSFAGGLSHK